MADSDDTTTLPALSRRDLLGGATICRSVRLMLAAAAPAPIPSSTCSRNGGLSMPSWMRGRTIGKRRRASCSAPSACRGCSCQCRARLSLSRPASRPRSTSCWTTCRGRRSFGKGYTESSQRTGGAGKSPRRQLGSARWRSTSIWRGIGGRPSRRPCGRCRPVAWPASPLSSPWCSRWASHARMTTSSHGRRCALSLWTFSASRNCRTV